QAQIAERDAKQQEIKAQRDAAQAERQRQQEEKAAARAAPPPPPAGRQQSAPPPPPAARTPPPAPASRQQSFGGTLRGIGSAGRAPPQRRQVSAGAQAPPPPPPPQAPAGPGMRFADKIGSEIPGQWREGSDYSKGANMGAGDLVAIERSDGAIRFGQVVAKTGLPWQNIYEVCVSVNADGSPEASRTEEAKDIFKPSAAALQSLGMGGITPLAQGSQLASAVPMSAVPVKKGTQFFSFFGGGNAAPAAEQSGEAVDRAAALSSAQTDKAAAQADKRRDAEDAAAARKEAQQAALAEREAIAVARREAQAQA
ncbi:hypothetical protein T484DRAFT_1757489, partial [Baffinella frigidus]